MFLCLIEVPKIELICIQSAVASDQKKINFETKQLPGNLKNYYDEKNY